jgi:mannose-6-phosphate isomerase-like protein (cupin superfamily)
MKKKMLRFGKGFKVIVGNRRAQAAQMVIVPGSSEENRHRGTDQRLLVIDGTGTATIGGCTYVLKRHTLLLIENGGQYQIKKSAGRVDLTNINFYSPLGYTKSGDERFVQ